MLTKRAPEPIESTGTLASGAAEVAPTPKTPPVATNNTPSGPPVQEGTNKILIAIVIALLLVIVALLARKH